MQPIEVTGHVMVHFNREGHIKYSILFYLCIIFVSTRKKTKV